MKLMTLICLALLTACASAPPETASYLLRSPAQPSAGVELVQSGIALGDVRVATYIEQPGLVLARGDGKIQAARNYTWAEPLQISLRRYMAQEISAASGAVISPTLTASSTTRINIGIDQLHGDGEGAAVLVAFWEVGTDEVKKYYHFSEREALASDGYDALAKAEQNLLAGLAAAIVKTLPQATAP